MWWIRQTPRYRKVTAVKRRVVREQVQGALKRLHATGETKTAIEHMLMREKKAAEKQGRKPDYENQILMDEVRLMVFPTISTVLRSLYGLLISDTRVIRSRASL